MVHLEIIWRDFSIRAKEPSKEEQEMQIFSDWGVVTVSKGSGSMLSMKSGPVGGRAMHEIAYLRPSPYYPWLTTDPSKDFNFGHEHPDAGSFLYFPDANTPVVTTSLYGPKHTHLQNTIEFYQSNLSLPCGKTMIGQLGDFGTCSKWLDRSEVAQSRAEIVFAISDEDVSFISAQTSSAYDKKWGIESSYRQLLAFDGLLFVSGNY